MVRARRNSSFNHAHESERTAERLQVIVGVSLFSFVGVPCPVPELSFGMEVNTPYCMRTVLQQAGSRRRTFEWVAAEIPMTVWTGDGPEHYMDMTVKRSTFDIIAVVVQISPEQFVRTCKTGTVDPLMIDGKSVIIGSLMMGEKQVMAEANEIRRALSSRASYNLSAVYLATILVPVPKGQRFNTLHHLEDSSAQIQRYVTNTKITTDPNCDLPTICVQISIISFPTDTLPVQRLAVRDDNVELGDPIDRFVPDSALPDR